MSLRVVGKENDREKKETRRLFFALEIPSETRKNAVSLVESFNIPQSQVRWVRGENLHITLKFLGDVADDQVPAISDAARGVAQKFEPIDIEVAGMGLFPNHEKPQIVWLGAEGETDTLASLEAALSKALEPLGFPADERRYTPHITIGRVKSDVVRGKLVRIVHERHHERMGAAGVFSIVLFESSLKPHGPVYSVVEVFPLREDG